jgi:hypothetical protein
MYDVVKEVVSELVRGLHWASALHGKKIVRYLYDVISDVVKEVVSDLVGGLLSSTLCIVRYCSFIKLSGTAALSADVANIRIVRHGRNASYFTGIKTARNTVGALPVTVYAIKIIRPSSGNGRLLVPVILSKVKRRSSSWHG